MKIRVLGPVTVLADDGTTVDIGGPMPQLALAMLATGGSRVPADSLVDQLWPIDAPETTRPKDPRQRLYELIHHLRNRLRAGCNRNVLCGRRSSYWLEIGRADVDLLRFHDLRHRADAALTDATDEAAAQLYREAFALWDSDGTFLHRSEPFAGLAGDWVARQRVHLEETYRAALIRCAEAELRLGRHGQLIPDLLAFNTADPLNESVAGLLMCAYYGAGQSDRALDTYARLRQQLDEELGTEPGAPLRELHRGVLTQSPALSLATPPDRVGRTSQPPGASARTAEPPPSRGKRAMATYINKASGRARVGAQIAVNNGDVHTGSKPPEAELGRQLRRLGRRLQDSHDRGLLPAGTMAAAQAQLARAQSYVEDADDAGLDAVVAALKDFQRLVDGADELVTLAAEAIALARRSDL
jgi:DNA-binding SARP family transcriptional activator